jgi:hypothetical protein
MPVNFFDENAKTSSSNIKFGLCVDPPPAEAPAYIDESDDAKWIGIVKNPSRKNINFYPIDHCIALFRKKIAREKNRVLRVVHEFFICIFRLTERESCCDGMLHYNDNLFFMKRFLIYFIGFIISFSVGGFLFGDSSPKSFLCKKTFFHCMRLGIVRFSCNFAPNL